jgi:tetratricopeptide (TPR) repeat protein
MQRNANILALLVALWIGVLPLCAQLHPGGNPFHSTFEQAQLDQAAKGLPVDALSLFMCGHPMADAAAVAKAQVRLDAAMNEILAEARPNSQSDALFRGLRARLFQRYAPIADVHAIFAAGEFNCVSATGLMAVAYSKAGIPVTLKEQPHHVFLYAEEAGHRLRIETTAADFGAIRESKSKAVSGKPNRHARHTQDITLVELVGLQYYNQGLAAMDAASPAAAMDAFRKAAVLYPSTRVEEMLPVAAEACEQAGMDALLRHDWASALSLLERAAPYRDAATIDVALSAAVLACAEQRGDWREMLHTLTAYTTWRPSLCRQPALGASLADALLSNAAHQFMSCQGSAFEDLNAFERLHAEVGCLPDPQIAALAYQAGFRAALRANDLDLASHCLQMGIQLAPADDRLKSQLATFSQQ